MDSSIYSYLSIGFSALAYVPYVRSVLHSNTRPTMSSWVAWCIMDIALFGSMIHAYVVGTIALHEIAWQMIAYVVGCIAVIGVCIYKHGVLNWTLFEKWCLGITLAALAGWVKSGNPNVAIGLLLVAIVVGTFPFLRDAKKDPWREPIVPWVIAWIGGTFGVMAIDKWTIASAATQVVFYISQTVGVFLVARKFIIKKIVAT